MKPEIVFCSDDAMLPLLGVALQSLEESASESEYNVTVLMQEVTKKAEQFAEKVSSLSHVSVRLQSFGDLADGRKLFTANRPDLSRAAYYRLLLPEVLPFDRVLYLDCDVIVRKDLAPLFETDLSGALLGAVRDYVGIGIYLSGEDNTADYYREAVGIANMESYCNSGVLLMDLAAMRKAFAPGQLMAMAEQRDWRNHDQDILNLSCVGRIRRLDAAWNCTIPEIRYEVYLPPVLRAEIEEAKKDPAIVHFAGGHQKPWRRDSEEAFRYFWPVAKKSPFYKEIIKRMQDEINEKVESLTEEGNLSSGQEAGSPGLFDEKTRDGILYRLLKMSEHQSYINSLLMQQIAELTEQVQSMQEEKKEQEEKDSFSRLLSLAGGNPDKLKRILPAEKLSFEVDLAGHCNLNCESCAHFSPLVEKELANANELAESFARLGELFSHEAGSIHLMGGEPLLHPQIEKIMKDAREAFSKAQIQVVTNGLLLLSMPESFWTACHDLAIEIAITRYPISLKEEEIRAAGLMFDVDITYFNNSGWQDVTFRRHLMDPSGTGDVEHNFVNCYLANMCVQLRGRKLYPCSLAGRSYRLREAFSCGIEECDADGIDIFAAKDAEEILGFLCRPIPFCRYCAVDEWYKNSMEWGISKKERSEWLLEK